MKKHLLAALSLLPFLTYANKDTYKEYMFNKYEINHYLAVSVPLVYLSYKALTETSKKVLRNQAEYEKRSSIRYHQYRQDKSVVDYAHWLIKNNVPRVKYVAMQTAAASALCVTTVASYLFVRASSWASKDYYDKQRAK